TISDRTGAGAELPAPQATETDRAMHVAPSFEALDKLRHTRDADLVGRRLIDARLNRGRGSQSNRSGRLERQVREDFDDGWDQVEELKAFQTVEHVERARSIITRNDSPD